MIQLLKKSLLFKAPFISAMVFLAFLSNRTVMAAINTATISANTIMAMDSCLHYQIIGLCYWLNESGINTTLKVSHYIPDAVITVYNKVGDNPWTEVNATYDQAAYAAGNAQTHVAMPGFSMESGQGSSGDMIKTDLHLKEVDVIGNPVVSVFGNKVLLPSQATAFFPYYQSMLDTLAWRFPPLETILYPQSLIPGLHDVGQWPINTWGSIYPRTGFTTQPNDAKAAAVVALRAGHIVTRQDQPHLYKYLSSDCGEHCSAVLVSENSNDTQWQMLSPIASSSCEVFGKNDSGGQQWGMGASQKANGAYAFNLWRRYHGCIQGDGKYIGSTDF